MLRWLKSRFGVPQPAGPQETLRRFGTSDPTLNGDRITPAQDGWLIDSAEDQVVRLFEVSPASVEQSILTYRAKMKSEGLRGRAFLEMWCRLPGMGEFFSKGIQQALTGTNEWISCETPFFLKKGQKPDLIKLNVAVEGRGKVWIKDIELLRTPLQ